MLVIGHRGAAGHCPENTISSVQKAVELGVDYVEVDVQATKDGEIVVFHDTVLDRVTNGRGRLVDHTYRELRENVLVLGRERIPTFAEVCSVVRDGGAGMYVEIKVTGIEEKVVEIVNRMFEPARCLVASFIHPVIARINAIEPALNGILLFNCAPVRLRSLVKETGCTYLGMSLECLDRALVKGAHESGLGALVYTVDDERQIREMIDLNVDGIVSNYPDRVTKVLGDRRDGGSAGSGEEPGAQ